MNTAGGGVLDADHPWPGLFPYGEDAERFFHGRERETIDLLRLVRRDTCTLFYGQSGLGKSSLLRAGLFPRLREEALLPIYVRLDFRGTGLSLREQLWALVAAALQAARIDGRAPRSDESLWAYFHATDVELWDDRNRVVTPVLVLDQFEEIVQAAEDRAAGPRLQAFLGELADLIENRVPESVKQQIEHDPEALAKVDFGAQRFRCVIGFREDFLADFEEQFAAHRIATLSRLRLTKMGEAQALDAVQKTGGAIVDAEVAARIVAFVAGAGGRTAARVLEIEPALLSVVCFELNSRRLDRRETRISADLLAGAQEQIIAEFYQRSVADQDPAVQVFIERELLTESGYRDSCAVEDAVQRHGIAHSVLQQLVERRVLRQEERFGVLRVELTHDVLAPVVRTNRDRRQAAEALLVERAREAERLRRTRRLLWIGGGLAMFASVLVVVFFNLFRQAEGEKARVIEAQSTLFLSRANASLENNVPGEPVRFLARALELNPNSQGALARLASLASQRRFARQVWEADFAYLGDGFGTVVPMDADGFAFMSTSNQTMMANIRMVAAFPALDLLCPLRTLPPGEAGVVNTFSFDVAASAKAVARSRIAETEHDLLAGMKDPQALAGFARQCASGQVGEKRKAGKAAPGQALRPLGMEPDGKVMWAEAEGKVLRLPLAGGIRERLADAEALGVPVRVHAAPKGSALLVIASSQAVLYARRDGSYERVAALPGADLRLNKAGVLGVVFAPDGRHALVTYSDKTCHLWDLVTRTMRWTRTCATAGHRFVPGQPWVGVIGDRGADGFGGIRPGEHEFALVDVPTGNLLGKVSKPLAINHVEYSAPGTRAVLASQDRTASVYELPAMTPVGAAMLHEGAVVEAHFRHGGRHVVTAAFDGAARVWDFQTGQLVVEPLVHRGPVLFARPVLGGTHVLTQADDRRLRLWRIARPTGATDAAPTVALAAPAVSADGEWLAFAEAGTWTQTTLAPGNTAALFKPAPATGPLATTVLLARMAGEPSTQGPLREQRQLYKARGRIERMGFSNGAKRLAVAGSDAWIAIVNVADGTEERVITLPAPAQRMVFDPRGQFLVVQLPDDSLRTYDLATGRQSGMSITPGGAVLDFGVAADGMTLTVVSVAQAQVVDLRTGYPLATLVPGGVVAAAVHPSLAEVALSTRGALAIWRPEVDRGKVSGAAAPDDMGRSDLERKVAQGGGQVVRAKKLLVGLRYAPDGRTLAAFSIDGAAWTWDLATLQQGPELRHSNSVVALGISQDSRWLVTTTLDGLARVWDYRTGQQMSDVVRLGDSERDIQIVGRGTWSLVETFAGTYGMAMLGLGFQDAPPPWFVPTVGVLAGAEPEADRPQQADQTAAAQGWWQSWLDYVTARNGVSAK